MCVCCVRVCVCTFSLHTFFCRACVWLFATPIVTIDDDMVDGVVVLGVKPRRAGKCLSPRTILAQNADQCACVYVCVCVVG